MYIQSRKYNGKFGCISKIPVTFQEMLSIFIKTGLLDDAILEFDLVAMGYE